MAPNYSWVPCSTPQESGSHSLPYNVGGAVGSISWMDSFKYGAELRAPLWEHLFISTKSHISNPQKSHKPQVREQDPMSVIWDYSVCTFDI